MLTKCMGAIEEVKGNIEGKKEFIQQGKLLFFFLTFDHLLLKNAF